MEITHKNKIMKKYLMYLGTLILLLFNACGTVEMGNGNNANTDGLLSFVVIDPKSGTEYRPTISGPYKDGETIYIKIPSPLDNPVDLANLKAYCSLQNDCKAEPALPAGIIDFTTPYSISVRDAFGNLKTNKVEIVLVKPKVGFERLWFKPQSELQLAVPGWYQSIAVTSQHLLIHDAVGFDATNAVRVYNRVTGAFVKSIPTPVTVTGQVCVDADENFVVTRINQYGAGFMVYFYEGINDNTPDLILNWQDGAGGSPPMVGRKANVLGSLKNGKAYIVATGLNATVYRWEFNNGVLKSTTPETISTGFGSSWTFASAKWLTTDIDSDMFITYYNHLDNDVGFTKGSRVAIVSKDGTVKEMNKSNHLYRVFDIQPFRLMGDDFLALSQQGISNVEPTSLRVFEVTNKENLSMTPAFEAYDQFSLLQSAGMASDNYTQEGDVAVYIDGNVAYIYQAIVASSSTAGVVAYKMTYYGN